VNKVVHNHTSQVGEFKVQFTQLNARIGNWTEKGKLLYTM